jgi:hypothetical protein
MRGTARDLTTYDAAATGRRGGGMGRFVVTESMVHKAILDAFISEEGVDPAADGVDREAETVTGILQAVERGDLADEMEQFVRGRQDGPADHFRAEEWDWFRDELRDNVKGFV